MTLSAVTRPSAARVIVYRDTNPRHQAELRVGDAVAVIRQALADCAHPDATEHGKREAVHRIEKECRSILRNSTHLPASCRREVAAELALLAERYRPRAIVGHFHGALDWADGTVDQLRL